MRFEGRLKPWSPTWVKWKILRKKWGRIGDVIFFKRGADYVCKELDVVDYMMSNKTKKDIEIYLRSNVLE